MFLVHSFPMFLEELLQRSRASVRILSSLLHEFFIQTRALENRVGTHTVDAHKEGSDEVSDNNAESSGKNGREEIGLIVFDISEDNVANKSSETSDENASNEDEDITDGGNDSELQWVRPDEQECVLGSSTEMLAGNRNLNVGILVQELDESLEALSVALQALQQVFHERILVLSSLFHLLFNVFQHQSHELNNCQ